MEACSLDGGVPVIRIDIRLLLVIAAGALVIAAGFACHLWGVESMDPCEIDAPMEQAQCRALSGAK